MSAEPDRLRTGERLLAVVCLIFPFRILFGAVTGIDLHLGLVCFASVAAYAAWSVREVARGFADFLDTAVLAFVGVALVDLLALTGPTPLAIKGFSVETRFAVFYFAGRFLSLRARFAWWLLGATMVLAVSAAVLGVAEHHLGWGALLDLVGYPPDRRFHKLGLPRLYSFPLMPVSAAYLFVLAIAAAAAFTVLERRLAFVVVTLVAVWQALPLTLTRTAFVLAVLFPIAFALAERRRGRWFLMVSLSAALLGAGSFWLRGWSSPLANYAQVGGMLADGSAKSHDAVIRNGLDLLIDRPWGYGFGEAGHLAIRWQRLFPRDDTYPITLGIQMGLAGLVAFFIVVMAAGTLWLRTVRSRDPAYRALGFAGLAIWFAIVSGSVFLPTFTMIVPQLYFWLLTATAANLLHEADEAGALGEKRSR